MAAGGISGGRRGRVRSIGHSSWDLVEALASCGCVCGFRPKKPGNMGYACTEACT